MNRDSRTNLVDTKTDVRLFVFKASPIRIGNKNEKRN